MRTAAFLVLALLAACGGREAFIAVPRIEANVRVPSKFASIEVREVSLPTYAATEEIFIEGADGALTTSDLLWADDPTRAVTLALSRNLAEITGRMVAPEPWPFDELPDGRVDVRVERFLSGSDGTLVLAGQYFVADIAGQGRDHAHIFDLSVPLLGGASPASAAEARARLVRELALRIARDAL